MKLSTTLLPFLMLCTTALSSQNNGDAPLPPEYKSSREAKRAFVVGVKAGINRSKVYDAQGMNFVANGRTGFAGGVYACIPLGGFFGIQPEVLFSQKGFRSTGTVANENYSLDRITDYIDVPLQLQLKPFRFLSLLGGVQYSYLVQQTDRFTYGVHSAEQSQAFKADNIRKNIFGAVCGIDINISRFVLSGRACWDLRANRGDGSSYTPRYRNLWMQATLGFRFY